MLIPNLCPIFVSQGTDNTTTFNNLKNTNNMNLSTELAIKTAQLATMNADSKAAIALAAEINEIFEALSDQADSFC